MVRSSVYFVIKQNHLLECSSSWFWYCISRNLFSYSPTLNAVAVASANILRWHWNARTSVSIFRFLIYCTFICNDAAILYWLQQNLCFVLWKRFASYLKWKILSHYHHYKHIKRKKMRRDAIRFIIILSNMISLTISVLHCISIANQLNRFCNVFQTNTQIYE